MHICMNICTYACEIARSNGRCVSNFDFTKILPESVVSFIFYQ